MKIRQERCADQFLQAVEVAAEEDTFSPTAANRFSGTIGVHSANLTINKPRCEFIDIILCMFDTETPDDIIAMEGDHTGLGNNGVEEDGDVADAEEYFGVVADQMPIDVFQAGIGCHPSLGAEDGVNRRVGEHVIDVIRFL